MKKKLFSLCGLIIFTIIAQAHEFWLKPAKFILKTGENLVINFRMGESFIGESWSFKKEQIEKLELHQKNTVKDVKTLVVSDPKINLTTPLLTEGTYILSMQTSEEFIETEAAAFNAYLQDYALDDADYARKHNDETDKNGSELVRWYSKLIVQAGEKTDNTFRKELGFPVEVVPEQNPYSLKIGDPVRFKVLYNKKPLFGVRVKVWNFFNNKVSVQNIFAQQDGMIETHITNKGSWMVSFAKMVPSKDSKADWQTLRASLVFGIR